MEAQMIDSPSALKNFINNLPDCKGLEPSLYIDLEGNNLSRYGTLSLITVLVEPQHTTHLVDVTSLGNDAFTVAGSDGRTLKSILESQEIVKVFFDIRNDSDALFGIYDIRVEGIEDLQLMELASRSFSRRTVNGLAKCIERDAQITATEKIQWKKTKDLGRKLFAPELGGTYAVLDQRPLPPQMISYCVQDVVHMPALRELYCARLGDAWRRKVKVETTARIALSQTKNFSGKGRQMALGPTEWLHCKPSVEEQSSRTPSTRRWDSAGTSDATNKHSSEKRAENFSDIVQSLKAMNLM
jgi:exonuclease 3'-5' domain-containing protein 1